MFNWFGFSGSHYREVGNVKVARRESIMNWTYVGWYISRIWKDDEVGQGVLNSVDKAYLSV